ncbi:ABC transporter permease [Alkalihalobacterium bogoriense]|uniref:ABC transporter permease n=1 Tax=Alkalihalobacterium bogoriense TaxID=246272 RepID=UPI00047DD8DE|nr:ABC transporter permease [Alkalihalobacterium bogoriense]
MLKSLFNQTSRLITFIVRRDRFRFLIWTFSLAFLTVVTASSFSGLYSTEHERQAIAETMRNPAMTAMLGPGYGLENYTEGPMMAHQMLLFTAVFVGIMNILLTTRHTRQDEEDGRIELIRSLPVGRLSNSSATVVVQFLINILLGFVTSIGLVALRIESIDMAGSLLYGASLATIGMLFTAITVFCAQLSDSSRGTIGLAFSSLGIFYMIRAIGDVNHEWLSWFSPLGWVIRTEVFVNNEWFPIVLIMFSAFVIVALALLLNGIRDLESGFLRTRPGKRQASMWLQSPFGLACRLQRTSIIAWAIGVFVLGVSYGSVFGDLENFFLSNEMLSEMLTPVEGVTLTEQFLTMLMSVISMICTIPALLMVLKLKAEENKNRIEHLAVRAVSRQKIMGSYLLLAIVISMMMQILAVLGLWMAADAVMEHPISFVIMLKAAMAYLPALWIMVGMIVFLIGYLPKLTTITWLYLGYSFTVVYLGGLLQFPEWMSFLSPFGHIPQLPVEEFKLWIFLLLISVSVVLIVTGFIGYRKRDLVG